MTPYPYLDFCNGIAESGSKLKTIAAIKVRFALLRLNENARNLTHIWSDLGVKSPQDPLSIHSMGSIPYGHRSPEYSSQRSKAPTLLTASGSGKSPNQQPSSSNIKVEFNQPQEEVSLKAFLELKARSSLCLLCSLTISIN
jgi:hypothetical protein